MKKFPFHDRSTVASRFGGARRTSTCTVTTRLISRAVETSIERIVEAERCYATNEIVDDTRKINETMVSLDTSWSSGVLTGEERAAISMPNYISLFRRELSKLRARLNARKDALLGGRARETRKRRNIEVAGPYDDRDENTDAISNNESNDDDNNDDKDDNRDDKDDDDKTAAIAAAKRRFYKSIRDSSCHGSKLLRAETVADVVNRSAVKLAEMDETLRIIPRGRTFDYLDIGSAPGGFIDYVNLRKQWSSNGCGLTLPIDEGGLSLNERTRIGDTTIVLFANILRHGATTLKLPRVDVALADCSYTDASLKLPREEDGPLLRLDARLLSAECDHATRALRSKGCLLIKTFAWFDDSGDTVKILLATCSLFESLHVYKPPHSRAGNDERYLFMNGYDENARNFYPLKTMDILALLLHAEYLLTLRQSQFYDRVDLNFEISRDLKTKRARDRSTSRRRCLATAEISFDKRYNRAYAELLRLPMRRNREGGRSRCYDK